MRFVRIALLVYVWCMASSAHAALLYAEGPIETYGPGDSFVIQVRLDPEGECINAARVVISYPTTLVKAVDFSRGDSIFSLWIGDPVFDHSTGQVIFEGGVPGGYCGRIQGDPALTNVLGTIVFSVLAYDVKPVSIAPTTHSELYLADGAGTRALLSVQPVLIGLQETATGQNAWRDAIAADTVAPEPFVVTVESTEDVFSGNYYAVFSTVDKQSGLDHYEIFERNAWKVMVSPYKLRDQALQNPVEIRAVDKAGNTRLGDYSRETVPERKARTVNPFAFVLVLIVLGGVGVYVLTREPKTPIA